MPSNSTIFPRNGPKRRQKAPKSAQCAPAPRNQERAVSWATWLKNEFRGHLVHPQPPTFYGSQTSESPNETPRPLYQWSLGAAGGRASPRTVGASGGSTRVPRATTSTPRRSWRGQPLIKQKDIPTKQRAAFQETTCNGQRATGWSQTPSTTPRSNSTIRRTPPVTSSSGAYPGGSFGFNEEGNHRVVYPDHR